MRMLMHMEDKDDVGDVVCLIKGPNIEAGDLLEIIEEGVPGSSLAGLASGLGMDRKSLGRALKLFSSSRPRMV